MYIPFESIPDHARLWIYQSNRPFTNSDRLRLEEVLKSHCDEWSAHGTPLHTSYSIQNDRFIILAVDEQPAGASGCSIDGSVNKLQAIQRELGLDLFDRTRVAFLEAGQIQTYPVNDLKTLFGNHTLSGDSVTFNNLVATKGAWARGWQLQVKDSWMARFLPKSTLAN
jgi:hypothetical protein